jgi:hypothetical protein
MKLRLLPIGISLILSLSVLFGGWFLYDSYAMETPMNQIVKETPGVQEAVVKIDKDRVTIELSPASDANVREIYKSIVTRGASLIGSRTVHLDIKSVPGPALDAWWSKALFNVAQSMETKRFGEIPARLEELKGSYEGLTVQSEMDESYVYITLKDDAGNSLYKMLPILSQKLGVWPNE